MTRFTWLACLILAVGCDTNSRPPCGECPDTGIAMDADDIDAAFPDDASDAAIEPVCLGRPTGAPCGGGRICIHGECVESRCGDGYVDGARAEECDLGPGCSSECRFLPCEPRACSSATRDVNGACVYQPSDEGSACEDGNACTSGDHCDHGACIGTEITQEASTRSVVRSFGAEPARPHWMEGVASFVSDDRIVFLESNSMTSSKLTLVEVGPSGLTRLSETTSDVAFGYSIRSVIYWGYEPTTFIVPMSTTRFAVVGSGGSDRGIEVFDIVGDTMQSRGFTALPPRYAPRGEEDGIELRGAAARADAIWLCGDASWSRLLRAYAFEESTGQFSKVAEIPVPSGGCNELEITGDGNRLFLAANGGYRIYDVSDRAMFAVPPMPERHTVLVPDHYIEDVRVTDTHVAVLTALPAGEVTDVVVFDREGNRVGTLAAPSGSSATPFGIAASGNRLYAEWVAGPYASPRFFTSVHHMDEPNLPSHAELTFRDGCCGGIETAVAPIARGDLVVLQPWRRVLRYDAGASTLDALTGLHHGSMRTILPRSATEVVALGPYSSHRIDLSDPDAPSVPFGGMNLPVTSADFQLAITAPGGRAQLIEPRAYAWDPIRQVNEHERFSMFDTSSDPPAIIGSAYVEGTVTKSMLGFGGSALFQVTPEGENRRVRRFASDNLIGLEGEQWLPDVDVEVPALTLPSHPRMLQGAVGVSATGSDVLVVETRVSNEPAGSFAFVLLWLKVAGDTVTKVAEATFPYGTLPSTIDIAIVGDEAIIFGNNRSARVRLDGSTITLEARHDFGGSLLYQRILYFDGERAMLARHDWLEEQSPREHAYFVDVIDTDDFSLVTSYRTEDEVRSMLVFGTQYLFGMNTGVAVVAPKCGP